MDKIPWWAFVALAGLAWGVYVPIIFYGGSVLGGTPNARLMAILCVGVAYFVLAVLFPLALFLSGSQAWPELKTTGLVFAALAGVAGAVGAICVVFASSAAVAAGRAEFTEAKSVLNTKLAFGPEEGKEQARAEMASLEANQPAQIAKYRMLIAPMIFGLAPVINTILSIFWHPKPDNPWHFDAQTPDWRLLVGIVMVAVGVALVLYSKEAGEVAKGGPPAKPATPTTGVTAATGR